MTTKIPPPIVAIVTAFLMWAISELVPVGLFDLPMTIQLWVFAFLAFTGLAIMLTGVLAFRKSKTTISPFQPEQASSLVLTGIYQKTRNPMYLGMLLILSGWAIFLGSAVAFLALPVFVVFMNKFQILPEEKALEELFGDEFSDRLKSQYIEFLYTVFIYSLGQLEIKHLMPEHTSSDFNRIIQEKTNFGFLRNEISLIRLYQNLSKKEIEGRVNDVIEFAELEKFADTKLKNFSSGMYARLAFATAVQVDPDIVLMDEILSVGDIGFQKKSYETFLSFKKKGKTIVIVTHNLNTIKENCERAMFLNDGKIVTIGEPQDVIDAYTKYFANKQN